MNLIRFLNFRYEWLRKLNKILTALTTTRSNADYQKQQQVESVRKCQKELVAQLMALVQSGCKVASVSAEASTTQSTPTSAGLPGNVQTPVGRHSILSQCGPVGYLLIFNTYILRSDLL